MSKALSTPLERSGTFENRIFEFLELSKKILTLEKYEDAILKSCGILTMETYLQHRSTLLKNYEDHAKILIEDMIGESVSKDLKSLLFAELSAVQSASANNAFYKFKSLQHSPSLKNGDSKWH